MGRNRSFNLTVSVFFFGSFVPFVDSTLFYSAVP